jgi:hypothetical protein
VSGPTPGCEQGATGRARSSPGLARCLSCQALPGSPVTRPLACQPEGVARCRREQPVNLCRGTPPRAGSSAGVCRGHVAAPRTFPPVVEAEGQSGAAPTHSATHDPPPTGDRQKGHPMGLFRTALLVGIGYALGRPAVRHELVALAGRIRRSPHHPDVINLGDREWTKLDGALHRPRQPRSEVGSGHPSSGLQWPRVRAFPRPAATHRRR